MGFKIQRLRRRVGRVASKSNRTIASPYADAGFPAVPGSDSGHKGTNAEDGIEDPRRYMHLHNTIIRALLVVPVTYEPGKLLRRNKDAVLIVTGADLVLVKMGRAATAGSIGHSASGHAAGGTASEAVAPAADGHGGSGAVTADANQATVLAQHELNKMVKCHATGNRLELEFIVTGSARFKVSAAALGFSNSILESAGSRSQSQGGRTDSMPFDEAVNAAMHQTQHTNRSRLSQQSRQAEVQRLDTAQQPGISATAAVPSNGVHATTSRCSTSHLEGGTAGSGGAATVTRTANQQTSRLEHRSSLGRYEPASSSTVGKAAASAVSRCSAPGTLDWGHTQSTVSAVSSADNLQQTGDSKKLVQWSAEQLLNSVDAAPMRASSGGTHRRTGSGNVSTAGFSRAQSQNLGVETADLVPAPPAEDASRGISSSISSFKLVKTDEGHYWVCVEAFTLQFRDHLMCAMAAELLQAGRASMRMAVDWLKQGLPFKPSFAVTHITELCSSRTGAEVLVSGPICWDTDLQLPDSWVRAINSTDLPEEQPLLTRLEVPEGPAAFKVHIATPAGLAEASLVPEFLAVLARSQQPWGQLLAVPVKLAIDQQPAAGQPPQQDSRQQQRASAPSHQYGHSITDYPTQHETAAADRLLRVSAGPAEQQQQESGLGRIGESRQLDTTLGDHTAGGSEGGYSNDSHDQQDASRVEHLLGHQGSESCSSSRSSLGQVDAQPESRLGGAAGASRSQTVAQGGAPGQDAALSRSSISSSTIKRLVTMPSRSYASAKGVAKGLLQRVVTSKDPSHRGSSPSLLSKMGSPARARLAFYVGSDSGVSRKLGLRRRDSADRLPAKAFRRSKSQPEGLATFSAAASDAASEPGYGAASPVDSDAESDSGTAPLGRFQKKASSSGDLVGLQHQHLGGPVARDSRFAQQVRQLSNRSWGGTSSGSGTSGSNQQGFLGQQGQEVLPNEVYAVLHVRLLLSDADDTASAAVRSVTATAGSASPFAAVSAAPLADSSEQGSRISAAPSIVMLGSVQQRAGRQMTTQEQQVLSAAGCLAAVLCAVALLFRQTAAGPLLILLAALVNLSCMALSARPGCVRSASKRMLRLLQRLHGLLFRRANQQRMSSGGVSSQQAPGGGLLSPRTSLLATTDSSSTKLPSVPADGGRAAGSGLRLRLLGASFVKEPLGLLQEQISAFKAMQDQAFNAAGEATLQDAATVPRTLQDLVHKAAADDSNSIILVSRPEPAWMTPDWRCRILQARQSTEERLKLAKYVHTWRVQYAADKLLKQHPPNFAWFQKQVHLKPLIVTPQGHVVILLKMASLVQASRNLAAAGLTAADMTAYCGFIWSFMFEVLATDAWPSSRLILVSDMKDLKLGQAMGEGQLGGRALGAVCNAWPERLVRCLVLGAPSWFNMLYRLIRPHLSPTTSAKIQVCDSAGAAAELAQYLGPDMVPREYGGSCTMLHDEYPAQKQLLEFVARLS